MNAKVENLSIVVSQTITAIEVMSPTKVERTTTGMKWNGDVMLFAGDNRITNRDVRKAIRQNNEATFEELEAKAQSEFGKAYVELTVPESQSCLGSVLADKIITGINESETGISVEDVDALVAAILSTFQ